MNKLLPAVAACAVLASASAQTMYKCMVDGKPSYGDRPCTNGVASELALAPTPAADPDTAARLARQHALAQQLTLRDVLADAAERQEQQRNGSSAQPVSQTVIHRPVPSRIGEHGTETIDQRISLGGSLLLGIERQHRRIERLVAPRLVGHGCPLRLER